MSASRFMMPGKDRHTGKKFENTIEQIVRLEFGYTPLRSKFAPWYRTQAHVGIGAFGTSYQADLLLGDEVRWPNRLLIECKFQVDSGTARDKVALVAYNIEKLQIPGILILGGGGFHKGIVDFLRSQFEGMEYPLAVLAGANEFRSWGAQNL